MDSISKEKIKKNVKYFSISMLVVFFLFFAIVMIAATSEETPKEPENLLSVAKYGEKYPYTIDNLELKCSPVDAVWVEAQNGDIYALNGLAMNKFNKDPRYKGNTKQILKKEFTDIEFMIKGFDICKKQK